MGITGIDITKNVVYFMDNEQGTILASFTISQIQRIYNEMKRLGKKKTYLTTSLDRDAL